MYSERDEKIAAAHLHRYALLLAGMLLLLAALYVPAVVKGQRALMLVLLVCGYCCSLLFCDLRLMPALRYRRFLRDMNSGLRRSLDCMLECIGDEIRLQDGVRVLEMQVRLCRGGDSRLFYVNVDKAALLPGMGTAVRITSFGRHVVCCEEI